VEFKGVKPSSFQHIVFRQKYLLLLLSYLWHYNRYFAFTHDNRAHPILNAKDVWHQKLVATINSKMEAVFMMCIHTGSYAHLITLITFGIPDIGFHSLN